MDLLRSATSSLWHTSDFSRALQTICMVSSLFLMGSGVPEVLLPVMKNKAIPAGKTHVPYVAMLVDTVIGILFTWTIQDRLGLSLRSFSLVLTMAYVGAFWGFNSHEGKKKMWGDLTMAVTALTGVLGAIFLYTSGAKTSSHALRGELLGILGTLSAIGFAASPLADIKTVLQKRDASSIPRIMVTVLLVCASSWALYGWIVLKNNWVVLPNTVNAVLAAAQLALSLAYSPTLKAAPLGATIRDVASATDAAVSRIVSEVSGPLRPEPTGTAPSTPATATATDDKTLFAPATAAPATGTTGTMSAPATQASSPLSSPPGSEGRSVSSPSDIEPHSHEKHHEKHHYRHGYRERSRSRSKGVRERRKSAQ